MDVGAEGNFAGKRLVVFGSGDIGGEVARQAVDRGMSVAALTRNPATAASLRAAGVEVVEAELAAATWHREILGADFVLNTVSSGGGGVEGYRRSYLEGMKSVVAWRRAVCPASRLIYTSSTSVYPQDGGVTVDESAEVFARDERAGVLIETEKCALSSRSKDGREGAAGDAVGGSVAVLRLAGIYGPGRTHLVEQVRLGEVSGEPGHHLNLIYRDDVCAAIWATMRRVTAASVFNVVDDHPAPKGEVVAWLAERLGVSPPKFTGRPAGGRRAVTPDRRIANGRLQRELGWRPAYGSFREGYAKFLSR